ncbi:MAG: aminotransferase class V-fold PLP-dependent enzyme [Sneathiella sp.]
MIPCQRHLFDIPEDIAYFNCGYMSPLLTSAAEAGVKAIDKKSAPWSIPQTDFFDGSMTARRLFAQLINAQAKDIAIIPAASYGLAVAAKNLKIQKGEEILVLKDQFPSNIYCWQTLCSENGGQVKVVEPPENHDWTSAVIDQISERTVIAALPHNLWTNGALLDLELIGNHLRKFDAKLVLDVTQSLGAMPLDISKIKPDFLIDAAYKWLLGPYSIGFMYVAPHHQDGAPLEHNWINRHGSEDFSKLIDYQDGFQEGAIRFDMGQRANFTLMPMAITALNQILEWGVENIYETLSHKTRKIALIAEEFGLTCLPEQFRAGHFLGLNFNEPIPPSLLENLVKDKIYLSARGNSLRITPHLYNNENDISRLTASLARQLAT